MANVFSQKPLAYLQTVWKEIEAVNQRVSVQSPHSSLLVLMSLGKLA